MRKHRPHSKRILCKRHTSAKEGRNRDDLPLVQKAKGENRVVQLIGQRSGHGLGARRYRPLDAASVISKHCSSCGHFNSLLFGDVSTRLCVARAAMLLRAFTKSLVRVAREARYFKEEVESFVSDSQAHCPSLASKPQRSVNTPCAAHQSRQAGGYLHHRSGSARSL